MTKFDDLHQTKRSAGPTAIADHRTASREQRPQLGQRPPQLGIPTPSRNRSAGHAGVVGSVQHSAKLLSAMSPRRAPSRITPSSTPTRERARTRAGRRGCPGRPGAARRRPPSRRSRARAPWRERWSLRTRRRCRSRCPSRMNSCSAELAHARRLHVDQPPPLDGGLHQCVGERGKAEPQRGRQRLGERADVGHPTRAIEPVERIERSVGVAELGVVVVLDDRRVVLLGERQQLLPPREAHRGARRRLVRRRRVHHAHVGRQGVDDQPFAVDRHRHDARARCAVNSAAHGRVARFLDGDRVVRAEHRSGDQVNGLLRPGRDHDVAGVDVDAAGAPDPGRQLGRAALRRRRGRSIRAAVGGGPTSCTAAMSAPGRGPGPIVRAAGRRRPRLAARVAVADAFDRHGAQDRRWPVAGSPEHGSGGADERSAAAAPGEIALGDEQPVDRRDRVPGHSELLGQFPRRWQAIARREPAGHDGLAELLEQRPGRTTLRSSSRCRTVPSRVPRVDHLTTSQPSIR